MDTVNKIFSNSKGGGTKLSWVGWIVPLFVLIILIEVFLGVRTLLKPVPAVGQVSPLASGKIVLVSNSTSYRVGDSVVVSVRVDTGGHSSVGTDLVLKYDPSFLQIPSKDSFIRGEIYKDYPIINIDNQTGLIRISGINSPGESGFAGEGVLGELVFKAKEPGNTSVIIESNPGATNLSNIIENGNAQNLLGSIKNLNVTIGSGGSSRESTSCSPKRLQICTNDQGNIGSQWCTDISDPFSCQVGCFTSQNSNQIGCKVVSSK